MNSRQKNTVGTSIKEHVDDQTISFAREMFRFIEIHISILIG